MKKLETEELEENNTSQSQSHHGKFGWTLVRFHAEWTVQEHWTKLVLFLFELRVLITEI